MTIFPLNLNWNFSCYP